MPAYQGCQQVLRELAEANRLLQTLQQTRCKSLPARAVVGHINTDRGGSEQSTPYLSSGCIAAFPSEELVHVQTN